MGDDDRSTKYELYEQYGVREYWLTDPDADYIEVNTLMAGKFARVGVFGPGAAFVSQVLGNRTIDVETLFAG